MKRFLIIVLLLINSALSYAKIQWLTEDEYATYDIKDGDLVANICIAAAYCDTMSEAMRISGVLDLRDYLVQTIPEMSIRDSIKYRVIYYITPEDKRGFIVIYERIYNAVYNVYYIKRRI